MLEQYVGCRVDIVSPVNGLECGILKQHHANENCSLIRFDHGGKEWLDLSHHEVHVHIGDTSTEQSITSSISSLTKEHEPSAYNSYESLRNSTTSKEWILYEWYQVGTSIELYDTSKNFIEGAHVHSTLIPLSNTLTLYNDSRGTFDILLHEQPHKIVSHGFHGTKEFPVDQIIEVYSNMKGSFRSGRNYLQLQLKTNRIQLEARRKR